MTPDNQAIESAQFSVICPKCGAQASTSVADSRPSMPCPGCGSGVDLTTDEVKHARQSAAAKASIQAHQNSGG
jgi:endogenous inhibitor of DNA gyrase (YacG/DUF329 family)